MRFSFLATLFAASPAPDVAPGAVAQLDEAAEAELDEAITVPDIILVTPEPAETVDDWIITFEMDATDFWFDGD